MKTRAVRMYGEMDLRLEEFELPEIKDDEILVKVISDSICMSTYKLAKQGKKHKRAPQDIDVNPIITGHECSGVIVQVGDKWKDKYKVGDKWALQPALNYQGKLDSPGYSYRFCGGDATYAIMPHEVMELDALLPYDGEAFYQASLGEPMSCIIGGYHANYHTNKQNYDHAMGTKKDGNILIMGGCGPMGLGAVSYGLRFENKPKRIVVTDVDDAKLARAAEVISPEFAASKGVELIYFNSSVENAEEKLMEITEGHEINLYNCHYTSSHILGTTGGNNDDLLEALQLSAKGEINPSVMVTHIGGLDSVADTTCQLPTIPGGKKLCYTQIDMPLTAIEDFEELGKDNELFAKLDKSCKEHNGLWNADAEKILFAHFNVEI